MLFTETSTTRPPSTRARPVTGSAKAPGLRGEDQARNLRLTEDVHDRLWLLVRQRK